MKLTTTFNSQSPVFSTDKLLYINGQTKEIIFQTDLKNIHESVAFFKNLTKFIKSRKVLKTLEEYGKSKPTFYQFAIYYEGELSPIKWFDLIVNNNLTISHDIAFNTTLIKKNKIPMPFGKFPMRYYRENIRLPKYRDFNIRAKAFKFFGNQIAKNGV